MQTTVLLPAVILYVALVLVVQPEMVEQVLTMAGEAEQVA